MEYPYPDEPTTIKAYQDRVIATYAEAGRSFPDPNDADAFRWFTRYGYDCRAMPEPQAAERHLAELRDALGLTAPQNPSDVPVCPRPLIGPLRVENKLFRDDTGYRRVLFCSWFPALRILRDNPAEFTRQLDAIVRAGYQGVRVFLAVGGWSDYWDGREVAPVSFIKWFYTGNLLRSDRLGARIEAWDDYDDLLRKLLRACKARKLRLHVTCGDMQIICPSLGGERDLHRRFATICQQEGGADVIALAEVTNEYPINRYGGDSPDSIAQMGQVIRVWKECCPGVLTAQGAPLSEEVDKLEAASTYGDVCVSHTTRDPFSMCMKRTYGLIHWEGNYRGFKRAFWQGEPAGPGADSFARQDDPANLTALYALHALTGQASNRFQGAAVRARQPLESEWGFTELPALMSKIPEDVVTWEHGSDGRGGINYWWKGKDFITAMYAEWNPASPSPVASWSLYQGNTEMHGTGTPPKATGLLIGRFA